MVLVQVREVPGMVRMISWLNVTESNEGIYSKR